MALSKLPIGSKAPEIINVVIEIPKGSHLKYEYDEALDEIKLDRVLHSAVFYPTEYGFIPETRSLDGDHLDVLVILNDKLFPGCIMEVTPIGVLYMDDGADKDEKIIAVATKDPRLAHIKTIEDVDDFYKKEIHHFFETYKQLENKVVKVHHWHGKDLAINIINESRKRYSDEKDQKI
jgi:inorganic pyrophosphatase